MLATVRPTYRGLSESAAPARAYGLLSTYAPTACGIATFSAALAAELSSHPRATVGVVRVSDHTEPGVGFPVVGELVNGSARSLRATIDVLNQYDVAIVQHEYGIYGGPDGDEVLAVLQGLTVPVILVAHTVVKSPTDHQRAVLSAAAQAASAVVVMTDAARRRLCDRFGVDGEKVVTIPHGAAMGRDRALTSPTRPTILSWGLLGPGKGVEWVIDALCELRDLRPHPRYIVAGRTHPKVFAADGDAYRSMLMRRAWSHGVSPHVTFDPDYRDAASLGALIRSADVVVLPYDSQDQVTSGVLVDAVAAGRPVVATAFPHAVELLSGGAGIVVPHRDPSSLAEALRRVLTEPGLAARMAGEAARLAVDLAWPAVAVQYAALTDHVLSSTAQTVS
jgi:glycosyltransferase involved in cell wall biosynthesis